MLKARIRRRLVKASALISALVLGGLLTMATARLATDTIVAMDTGSLGKTIARNLAGSQSDIRAILADKQPTREFSQILQRAIGSDAIYGYRLYDIKGNAKYARAKPNNQIRDVRQAAIEAAITGKRVTRADWQTTAKGPAFVGYAIVPLIDKNKVVAIHAIGFNQTDRWKQIYRPLLYLMMLAGMLAIASIGTPVLLWYQKNRALIYQEGEMRTLLARFQAVFNNMPQGVTLFDKHDKLILANQQYAKYYKLDPGQIKPGTPLEDLRGHRRASGTVEYTSEAGVENTSRENQVGTWRLDDGRTIETRHHPVPGGGWVTVHNDITEQLARETELKGARKFLNSVIDHMPGAVIVKKPDNLQYLLINRQVEQMIGLPRNAIVGKTSKDFFSAQQALLIDERDRRVLEDPDQSVHDAEQSVETPGNGPRTIATKRIVVRDENNIPAYLITMTDDVTEKRQAEQRVRYLAMHDTLTGLYNRTFFHEQLEHYLANAEEGGELALILIDLDGFKEVNDTFGHAAGDEVLRVTGNRLNGIFCDLDFVARLGGDEFAILCRSASCHLELQSLAKRIIADINIPIEHEGRQITVGATAGVAITRPGELDAETILRYVDIAMYEAKDAGKSNFCFFDLGMMMKRLQRKQLEMDMVDAISRGEFELHYQPIVDPRTNTVRSLEALLRWNHRERGMISPLEFIPVAEETGLILPIGEHVLEMACAAAKLWPSEIRISVNLSPIQFRDRKLASKVLAILERTGMQPKRLELEITEAALLHENEHNLTILEELRTTGVRIVMDDFGTGYSSLNYLRSFPFDKIKIDRSYIKDLVKENGNSLTIVQAVLGLAAGLSLSTTAEGVETQEQLDILNAAGCDEIQGYFFSKPIPAIDIPALIAKIARNSKMAA